MSTWTLLQITFDMIMFVGLVAAWLRLRRPPQDDPRLSRGLQLLQTKITVLEDLSDRTDAQVKQLTGLLDQKTRFVQNKILEAEQQVLKIDHSMTKSLEVAEIFQDKIPHEEILERQRTIDYVKAARMAHAGASVDEIMGAVRLPREQVELIAKFNREHLMFDEDQLPDWAKKEDESAESAFALKNIDFVNNLEPKKPDLSDSARIEKEFKQAVQAARQAAQNPPPTLMDNKIADSLRGAVASGVESVQPAVMSLKATANTLREKLVSTAEDLLRASNTTAISTTMPPNPSHAAEMPMTPNPMAPPSVRKVSEAPGNTGYRFNMNSPVVHGADVKRVIFPRIEK